MPRGFERGRPGAGGSYDGGSGGGDALAYRGIRVGDARNGTPLRRGCHPLDKRARSVTPKRAANALAAVVVLCELVEHIEEAEIGPERSVGHEEARAPRA